MDRFSEINMANIHSSPAQPRQQQAQSMSKINGNNFYAHFGYVFFENRCYEKLSVGLKLTLIVTEISSIGHLMYRP
jgi:hypothetical protein